MNKWMSNKWLMLTQRKLYSLSNLSRYSLIFWWGPGMKEELFFLSREEEMSVFEHLLCVGNFTYQSVSQSVQSLSCVRLFETPWIAARQASLSITNSWSLPKLVFIELVMPSNHLILYRLLLFLPSIFHSIRVFYNESALHIRWPK